jgi:hypothetical protein
MFRLKADAAKDTHLFPRRSRVGYSAIDICRSEKYVGQNNACRFSVIINSAGAIQFRNSYEMYRHVFTATDFVLLTSPLLQRILLGQPFAEHRRTSNVTPPIVQAYAAVCTHRNGPLFSRLSLNWKTKLFIWTNDLIFMPLTILLSKVPQWRRLVSTSHTEQFLTTGGTVKRMDCVQIWDVKQPGWCFTSGNCLGFEHNIRSALLRTLHKVSLLVKQVSSLPCSVPSEMRPHGVHWINPLKTKLICFI